MKTKVLGVIVASLLVAGSVVRAEKGVGVGVIVGEPTGLSLKKWIGSDRAIDAAAAWSFSENDSFQFHADYLIHRFGLIHSDPAAGRLPVYFGLGGRVKLKDDNRGRGRNDRDSLVGIRFPVGVSYLAASAPFELFAEIVPVLDVVPDSDFDINAAIGARYYFR